MDDILTTNRRISHRRGRFLSFWSALGVAALVASGCGGEDGSAPAGGGGGQSWTVSGTPPAQVVQGTAYSFTPTVSNPNGVSLTFSYSGLPSWATANASNGSLSGTPGAGTAGTTYANIRLTVTDGTNTFTSPAYSVQVVGTATGSAMLSWMPPTTYTNGNPLQIAGYKVYFGTSQNNLNNTRVISQSGISSYVVDQLTPGTWYFAVTVRDSAGVESVLSNVASKTI